ncbi:MAG: penicillin-binding protein 1C [Mediterranea sp.]|jgi:penicillin-binding protein 1C|nr:penicillin-binding protein 1C [Mediterranea sp.]
MRKRWLAYTLAILLVAYYFCLPHTLFRVPYSTVVTDGHGELLGARVADDGQWRFPPRSTVPPKVKVCLTAFEDRYFAYHWGVNPVSLVRAFYQNIKAGHIVSGGSTLTMQTIRLARNRPRTVGEKLIETVLATRLEFRASKAEILRLYASHAPFGGNVVGLDAAAWRYFGHPADELSWAEAAMLAVLPNAPAMIHPAKGRTRLLEKRNRLLHKLYAQGELSQSDYELALTEPLPEAPYPLPQYAPHWVARQAELHRGEHVVSTLDKGIQQRVEALAEQRSDEFARSDIRNLAVLVIELQTGQPVAYVGNVHFAQSKANNQVDIIRAPRSTGSILKPFLYYALLEEGSLLPHTLLPDVPTNINGFAPQNFNRRYEGAVPADEALARSLNIPAVHALQRYGVPKLHDFLKQAGVTTLTQPPSHYGLSLILGGAEATLWEVTRAYADMGRSLLHLPQSGGTERFEPGGVWQTFEALKEVNRPEEIDPGSITSLQTVAWKTGTSYGFRDAWAVGVTPRYAVGVWVGNATGEGKPELVGARTAAPVLFDVFNLLPRSAWFTRPDNVFTEAAVCRRSGQLAGRFCAETDTVLILPSGRKSEVCSFHRQIDGQSWFVLPPVWEWYYRQYHPEYQPIPPRSHTEGLLPMQFIYPTMNARITLPKQLDGNRGFLTAELAHSHPQQMMYWHLDNTYLGQTQDIHKMALQPAPGRHSLTVVDEEGNSVSVSFEVLNPVHIPQL